MQYVTLPDGTRRACGARRSVKTPRLITFPPVKILDKAELVAAAQSGDFRGRARFGDALVSDTGESGASVGHAFAAALAKARVLAGYPAVKLSGAYLYSLVNGGVNSGAELRHAAAQVQSAGIASDATVGNDAIFRERYDAATADAEARTVKGAELVTVSTASAMISALAQDYIMVAVLHADAAFAADPTTAGEGIGNTAVHVDGLTFDEGTESFGFDGVLSWGSAFGDSGRVALTWRHFFRPATLFDFFGVRVAPAPK